ncbi:MAG: translation elongation factor Ts [Phycisphaerales bacterium]
MAGISAKEVMSLRNKTGLAMMECKKALTEAGGDIDKAEDLLRKKLKGKMEGKTDRIAGEGRIGIAVSEDGSAAIVEIKAETDFTAKNDNFINATDELAKHALSLEAGSVEPNAEMSAIIDNLRITTGENISIGRIERLSGDASSTVYGQYIHHDGKTGVLIQAQGELADDTIRQIAMHVAAAMPRPLGLSPDDIPSEMVDKEKKFRLEQAMESGKPESIAEKIVEGGMRKFFEDVALLEQDFVMDTSKKIKDLVGSGSSLSAFTRWQVGEAE